MLGWTDDGDEEAFVYRETADVFATLLTLSDADVMRIAAFFMARSLAVGSASVEAAGAHLKVDARAHWQPDDTFFDLIRDRATLNAMLAEIAGEAVARGNVAEKAKLQKQIIRDCLTGANGRAKVENWLPGWLCFPMRGFGDGPQAEACCAERAGRSLIRIWHAAGGGTFPPPFFLAGIVNRNDCKVPSM